MNITYRAGRGEDCLKLAEFIYIASDGVVEFLFRDLIPRCSPQQIVAQKIDKDTGPIGCVANWNDNESLFSYFFYRIGGVGSFVWRAIQRQA